MSLQPRFHKILMYGFPDNQDPSIECPLNASVPTDPGLSTASVTYPSTHTASDNSGIAEVIIAEFTPRAGQSRGNTWNAGDSDVLGIGTHSRYYLATDAAGNEEFCAWSIEVYGEKIGYRCTVTIFCFLLFSG